jgi:hypothetical protein
MTGPSRPIRETGTDSGEARPLRRLSAVTFNGGINDEFSDSYYYLYSYTPPGRVGAQMMGVQAQPVHQLSPATWLTFSAAYQWDNEGRMTSLQYPTVQVTGWGNYPR